MSCALSSETQIQAYLITMKTYGGQPLLTHENVYDDPLLALLAKYQNMHGVTIYAFHASRTQYSLIAGFPGGNKGVFLRDLNAAIAKTALPFLAGQRLGKFWVRRSADVELSTLEEIEHAMVRLAARAQQNSREQNFSPCSDSPCYDSFQDATADIKRSFHLIDRTDYNNRKRYNRSLTIEDCTHTYTLTYTVPSKGKLIDQLERRNTSVGTTLTLDLKEKSDPQDFSLPPFPCHFQKQSSGSGT